MNRDFIYYFKGQIFLSKLIHPTAIIHPEAQLHPTVKVGPFSVIENQVKIGANTEILAHVTISGPTEIGENNRIFPGAVIGLEPQDLKYQGGASGLKIGNYNTIRECVTINRATAEGEITQIGDHNLLMAYTHVAHNCILENNIIIANNVALAGHVKIESRAVIGGVLGVHQFVHIGKMAMLGGMSRIDRDVPPFMLVEGNPSQVRALNLVGLKRAGLTREEMSLLKKAFSTIYHNKISFTKAIEELKLLSENTYISHLYNFLKESTTNDKRRGVIPGKTLAKGVL
jgi:UDP-N-acetylglucosamine acyltransferase